MKNLICKNCGEKNKLFWNSQDPVLKMIEDYKLNKLGDISFS